MRLSLVPRELVDIGGVDYRVEVDIQAFGISSEELRRAALECDGFKDHGLVWFDGAEYYMATYTPPDEEEQ